MDIATIQNLPENELAELIQNAQKALADKQHSKKREVIAQIKELAASIGCSVEITDIAGSEKPASSRRGGKVAVKYRDPANPKHQWTGRGMKPKWLRELIEQGRSLDEFAV